MRKKYERLDVRVVQLYLTDICTASGVEDEEDEVFRIGYSDELGSF